MRSRATSSDSPDFYRPIFSLSPDPIVITNSHGVIEEANIAFLRLVELRLTDILSRSVADFIDPESREDMCEVIERLREGETVSEHQILMYTNREKQFIGSMNALPLTEQGAVRHFIFIIHDITANITMHQMWRTLSSIVESTDDAIVGKKLDGTVVSWNRGAERMYGYSSDEMTGQSILKIVPEDRIEEMESILNKISRGERLDHIETVRRCKTGELIEVSITISPIVDDTGTTTGASAIARDITQQKKIQQKLLDSEKRYRGLVESQNDLIVRVAPDGTFTYANDAYCRKFGKTHEEIIGKSFVPLVHEDDIRKTLDAMKGLDVPPYRITVEQRAMTVEGWRWITWEDYAIKDENGTTTEIQAIGRDITERKLAEIALTESQKKYQSVFDKANDYMVLLDSRGAIIEINERIKTKLGYTRDEMIGHTLLELPFLQPESRQKAMANFKKRISGHDVSTYELTFVKKDGDELIGEVNASLVETGNGEIVDLVVIRDITERKKAEEDRLELINILQQMTEELNTVLESIGDAIVTIDNNLTITSANSAFCTLVGRTFEEIIGKSCNEIIQCSSEKDTESCSDTCGLKETLASSTVHSERSIIRNSEGRLITIEAISSPLRNAEGKITGAVKSIRDISKEVEVEKMKNEFVSTVSHELRTPLTSIKGYIELILDGDTGDINDIQREFLDIIAQNTDRLTSLINDLLDIEKIESGKIAMEMKPVSLTKLVKLAAKTLEPDAHDKELEFEVTVADTIEVFADPDRIMQVLMNLISNAIKFTPSGKVSIHVHKHPGRAEIIVSDTGMGISKTDQENLFTKFFRAENARKKQIGGTGLGLSIVKSIVEMHGGSVTVDSTLNRGSTFTVVLPIGEE